jgi:hypothetical protein
MHSDNAEDQKEVSLMKKTKRTKKNINQSPGKFHYRSCDNRESSSRMRELIYFHENDKSNEKNIKAKTKMTMKNDDEENSIRLSHQRPEPNF